MKDIQLETASCWDNCAGKKYYLPASSPVLVGEQRRKHAHNLGETGRQTYTGTSTESPTLNSDRVLVVAYKEVYEVVMGLSFVN